MSVYASPLSIPSYEPNTELSRVILCRRNLPVIGDWPNSTQAKDLSVSAIAVIAQFPFRLISGASTKGEYLRCIQERSCAQLRQHSVYSHLTDRCPRSELTQPTGRVPRERNAMRGGLEWGCRVAKTKTVAFFLLRCDATKKLMDDTRCAKVWGKKGRVWRKREESMIHVFLEFETLTAPPPHRGTESE